MIVTAILIACLTAAPTECRTHEFRLFSVLPTAQWKEAETRAAEYMAKHPDMRKRSLRIVRGQAA